MKIWRAVVRGGVKWHRKRSGWLVACLIRKFHSISYRLKTRFLPAFAAFRFACTKNFCVPFSVCCACGNSGIVGFFSWTCAHHRRTRSKAEYKIFLLEISFRSNRKIFSCAWTENYFEENSRCWIFLRHVTVC